MNLCCIKLSSGIFVFDCLRAHREQTLNINDREKNSESENKTSGVILFVLIPTEFPPTENRHLS